MEEEKLIKAFKSLADSKRLEIIKLIREEEKCACVLLENLDLTQSGLSYHMKILSDSGIIKSRQEGKWTYYKIDEEGIKNILSMIREISSLE